ncbi:MAG: ROK family protein [Chthoniobacterales bacterium]
MKRVLVIDIGGSHVKLMISRSERRKVDSGPDFKPSQFATAFKVAVKDWKFDAISIGFPSPVKNGRITADPKNLGRGWMKFDFRKALGKPVQVVNDAAMQALGSYRGGRMLFLGLGTGLGSTLIWNNNVLPLELGDLPYENRASLEDWLGKEGLKEIGEKQWLEEIDFILPSLRKAFIADYIVLGGGNAKDLESLPDGVELGHNRNAYRGGVRLWEMIPHTRKRKWNII